KHGVSWLSFLDHRRFLHVLYSGPSRVDLDQTRRQGKQHAGSHDITAAHARFQSRVRSLQRGVQAPPHVTRFSMSESIIQSNASLWQDSMTASGDSRGHRGKPDWTDIVF